MIATSFQFHPSPSDRWNEVFREELLLLLLLLFLFSFPDLELFLPNWGNSRSSFITRFSQRQIKMTFASFIRSWPWPSSISLLLYVAGHYYTVLPLWIFTNIRVFAIFSVSWIFKRNEISFRFRETCLKSVEKKKIFLQTCGKIPMFIHEVFHDLFSLLIHYNLNDIIILNCKQYIINPEIISNLTLTLRYASRGLEINLDPHIDISNLLFSIFKWFLLSFSVKKQKFRFSNVNWTDFFFFLETTYKYQNKISGIQTKCHGLTSIYDYRKKERDRERERAEISKTFPLIEQDNLSC